MKIHIVRNRPTPEQIREMLEELETYDPGLRTKSETIIRRLLEAESV